MSDTRFVVEMYLDKEGYLTGSVRLPKEDSVTLETLGIIVEKLAEKTGVPFDQVLKDIWYIQHLEEVNASELH